MTMRPKGVNGVRSLVERNWQRKGLAEYTEFEQVEI